MDVEEVHIESTIDHSLESTMRYFCLCQQLGSKCPWNYLMFYNLFHVFLSKWIGLPKIQIVMMQVVMKFGQ